MLENQNQQPSHAKEEAQKMYMEHMYETVNQLIWTYKCSNFTYTQDSHSMLMLISLRSSCDWIIPMVLRIHHLDPASMRGRNSCSNMWLKGPCPTSCKRPIRLKYENKNQLQQKITRLQSSFPFSRSSKYNLYLQVSQSAYQGNQYQALNPTEKNQHNQHYQRNIGFPN